MKKRILSILLILCMVLCLVPTSVFAEGETAGKAAAANSEVSVTVTSAAEFIKAIDDSNSRTEETTVIRIGKNFTVSLSECEGYFLIKTKVIIDLNYHGFSIKQDINSDKAFYLTDGAELTIRDSTRFQYGVLKIIGNGKKAISAVRFSGNSNATLRLESGTLEGENLEYNRKMVDGRVYGTPGGFVRLDEKNSKFIMTGGTIKNFYGVYGGAVSVEYGKFVMEGGTIQNCYARNGGAISVDYGKNAVLTIGGGSGTPVIKNNSAIGPGGGLAVSDTSSKVEIKGGLFEDNYSTGSDEAPVNLKNGAELYVGYGCEVKMSGGTIKNSGTGQYAISSEGKFTVTGDAVIDVSAEHCTLSCAGENNYFFDFDNGYAIIKGRYAAGDAFSISKTNGLRFGADENSLGEIKQGFRNEDISNAQYIKIAKKRTVTFKLAENEPTTLSSQTVLNGEKIQKPVDPPLRDGYVFNDIWAIPLGDGYKHWDFGNDVLTEDTTLYGRWSGYRVKVTFNANGYSMSGQSEIYGEYGQKLKDLSGVPTINPASFMKFIGWYTQSNGGTKVDENTVLTDNMTLYAKCAPQYTVFICYQYENDEGQRVTLQTMNHLDENGRVPKPSVQPVHKTGYVFDDWYVGEVSYGSLTDNYTNLKTVADLFREYGTMDGAQGRIYLVARYVERNDYSVIFKSEDSVIDTKSNLKWTDKVLDGVSVPTRDGYDFAGFKYGDKTVTADIAYADLATDDSVTSITLTAQWTLHLYTVTLDANGGTFDASGSTVAQDTMQVTYGGNFEQMPIPRYKGYFFRGWYDEQWGGRQYGDEDGRGTYTYDKTEDCTLYALWEEAPLCTVTFDPNGGTLTGAATCEEKQNECIQRPYEEPVREGHNFRGWYTDAACKPEQKWDFDDPIPGNMTLYAGWDILSYVIRVKFANGEPDSIIDQNYDTPVTVPDDPTREGYTFIGWDTPFPKKMPAKIMEITALWQINRYKITFDTDGGSEIDFIEQDYGTAITAPADPTREGYTFIGWDKVIPKTMPAENMTITAQWKDSEKPTGEIKINENSWKAFLNNITFGLFFKDTQTVTINAADNSGETVTVEYLLSAKELTKAELDGMTFTAYNAPFGIDPDNEYIIYVRLTDKAGNTDYICSDGIVLDGTSPVITGIENGKTYCAAQTVTVDEKYVGIVTVNGTEVELDENGSFVLSPADSEQKIVAADRAGNTAEMTVTVNDGHTFGEWTSNGNGTHTRQCTADGCTEGVETDNCTDEDKNHICDICGNIISNHEDANKNHICDYCEKVISNHEDADQNHICDYCGKVITNHEDTDKNHICDYCEKVISNHADADKDHICDICGKVISNHADADKNHICDYCEKIISNHEDADKNHICDYCGKIITNHTGGKATCKDKAVCEVCEKAYGELDATNHLDLKHIDAKAATKDAEGNIEYWYCEGCGKYYSDAAATKEITKAATITAKLPDNPKSPQTGDTSNLALWIALLFISGGAVIGTTVVNKKKKHNI